MKQHKFSDGRAGARLAYVEQGARDGVPVVLLHGLSDSHHSYDLMAPLLPGAWRVIAVTLRGHGHSDQPEADYAMADLAGDVVALLDELGIARAVIVGHSLSSGVALQFASAYPERTAGIVLLGAFANFATNQGVRELEVETATFETNCGEEFARAFQESTLANPIPPAFLDLAVSESLLMPAHAWRGVVQNMAAFDPRAAARQVRAPAAIIWGDRDAYCPYVDQITLRNLLGSARFLTLAGVGHALHWERPADVAALVRAFVAELDDSGMALVA